MSEVTQIHCNPPVATLEGLEQFSALTQLSGSIIVVWDQGTGSAATRLPEDFPLRNTVNDLSPISGLTSLNNLTLIGSLVDSLEQVSRFTNLQILDLSADEDRPGAISDLEPFRDSQICSGLRSHSRC